MLRYMAVQDGKWWCVKPESAEYPQFAAISEAQAIERARHMNSVRYRFLVATGTVIAHVITTPARAALLLRYPWRLVGRRWSDFRWEFVDQRRDAIMRDAIMRRLNGEL